MNSFKVWEGGSVPVHKSRAFSIQSIDLSIPSHIGLETQTDCSRWLKEGSHVRINLSLK